MTSLKSIETMERDILQLKARIAELEGDLDAKTLDQTKVHKLVFDDSIASHSVANKDGIITHVNPAFIRMWGYESEKAAIGNSVGSFFVNPEDAAPVLEALAAKDIWEGEFLAKRADGKTFVSHGAATSLRNDDGDLIGYQSTNLDVTKQRKSEQQLARSTRQLEIRNRIAEVFLMVPEDEMYAHVLEILLNVFNSRFGVFGYLNEKGDLVVPTMTRHVWEQCQVPDKDLIFPREKWGDSIWPNAIREKKILHSNEQSKLVPEGHLPIHRNVAVPLIHRGQVIGLFQIANKPTDYDDEDLALARTISDMIAPILNARLKSEREQAKREVLEKELREAFNNTRELNSHLERSNKELEQFAYVASHDLQEPLRMVASYTQLLAKRYEGVLDEKADKYIKYAVEGATRMQGLIDDLLALSRVGTRGKKPEPTNCNQVLNEVLESLKGKIEETGAKVTAGDLPVVMADPTQLWQVFQNLINNALKFRSEAPPKLNIFAEKEGDFRRISVRDNGIGIETRFHDRIFTIFQRLHERGKYPGSGIGLSIVKKIAERHGGRITVESKPGEGSTFTLTLPGVGDEGKER